MIDFEKMFTEPMALSEPSVAPPQAPTRESLRGLAYALRHPETWPKGFVWDYNDCKQCAMGLAHTLWLNGREEDPKGPGIHRQWVSMMARRFSMPYGEAEEIFLRGRVKFNEGRFWGFLKPHFSHVDRFSTVTPEMVANAIDDYLARA